MSRLLPLSSLLLTLCVAGLSAGCHNIYRDVYSTKRNFFVPPAEKKIELPPAERPMPSAPVVAAPTLTPPAADGGAAAGAAAIPGLEPMPGM